MGQWAPVDLRGQHQGQEGPRQERSAGSRSRPSTAAPARPASSSAAATASPSARTPRRRRSTSSSSSSSPEVANKGGASGAILPVAKGTESSVTDPNMKAVLDARSKASFVQLYLDQAYAPAVGQAVNDAVQQLFAGKASPEQVVQEDRGCRQGRLGLRHRLRQARRRPQPPGRAGLGPGQAPQRRAAARRIAGGRGAPGSGASGRRSRSSWRPRSRSTACSWSSRSSRPSTTASTTGTGSSSPTNFVGLDNFKRAFNDDVFRGALKHNVHHHRAVAGGAAPVRARGGLDRSTSA